MNESPTKARARARAAAIDQSLTTSINDQVQTPVAPIGQLPSDVARRLAEDLKLGQVSAELPYVLAKHGGNFDSAASLNAANGSNLVNAAEMTSALVQTRNFITDRESALMFLPLLCDVSKVLTKVTEAISKQRVNIAKANNGYKAVSGAMFIPRPSFKPGEIIEAPVIESKTEKVA